MHDVNRRFRLRTGWQIDAERILRRRKSGIEQAKHVRWLGWWWLHSSRLWHAACERLCHRRSGCEAVVRVAKICQALWRTDERADVASARQRAHHLVERCGKVRVEAPVDENDTVSALERRAC